MITDSYTRAAVWRGPYTGTWYVDVYFAYQRTPGAQPHERVEVDAIPLAEVIEVERATFADAIASAARIVGSIRWATKVATQAAVERSHAVVAEEVHGDDRHAQR